jgi:hypothetical protein
MMYKGKTKYNGKKENDVNHKFPLLITKKKKLEIIMNMVSL